MVNADDFCQFARLGQTMKIQKCLQTHSVDVNALNLYGESALSTATYYNQILCVEYLLANKADPKFRLSAGHTTIHIACRLGNVPILHMLLTIKKEENNNNDDEQQQQREDKHLYDCLRMKDNSNLTAIHWAATQESVSKRQKMFAYVDRRMPGVLDSRYNLDWFNSWAKLHPWVIEHQPTIPLSKLTNIDNIYRQNHEEESSEITSLDITPKASTNDYERTPRAPLIAPVNNNTFEEKNQKSTKLRVPRIQIEQPPKTSGLPPTPITSCKVTVTSIYHIPKNEHKHLLSPKFVEHRELPRMQKQSSIDNTALNSQKTPTSSIITNAYPFSPLSDRFTYRAHRVHIEPTIDFPPPPSDTEDIENNKGHDYEDMNTPLSSKRPSHNLLSNITPSTDQSSQQSTKQIASSSGFDTSIDPRHMADTTIHSNTDTYAQNEEQLELESVSSDDEDRDYESNQLDYLCRSTSTLGVASPGAHTYYA